MSSQPNAKAPRGGLERGLLARDFRDRELALE
jgi:hypothetical protein